MLEWPNEDLYFAVIDGPDPAGWIPWGTEALSFGNLRDKWKQHAESAAQPQCRPEVTLKPLTDPIDHLLKIGRMRRIVGAVIETPSAPTNTEHYTERMDRLMNICLGIMKGERDNNAMFRKVRFEIWFMVDDRDIGEWDRWNEGARTAVSQTLRQDPMVHWVRNSEGFLDAGDHFLADCRFNLTFRAD